VIPPAWFTVMVTPSGTPMYPQGGASPYAMGWVLGTEEGRPFVWHNGETAAFTSFKSVFLDDGFSVRVLTNMPVKEAPPSESRAMVDAGDLQFVRDSGQLLSARILLHLEHQS
jgi:hypothetical protein